MARKSKRDTEKKTSEIIEKLKSKYDSVGDLQHGVVKVKHHGKYGFFDAEGHQTIPFMYEWTSSFNRIRLYGKVYIGAFIIKGDYKSIVDMDNKDLIAPMGKDTMYYIIDEKLWVKGEDGYSMYSRTGQKLLDTGYECIINDRFRQPKNVYLVKKGGLFGAIHVNQNDRTVCNILPFNHRHIGFWYSPIIGTLIETSIDGENKGLHTLDDSRSIPEEYTGFTHQTPFRKAFILASGKQECTLYEGKTLQPLISSPHYIQSRYTFYSKSTAYYTISTTAYELLVDDSNHVVAHIDRQQHISLFHYLMRLSTKDFRFKSLKALVRYANRVRREEIRLTPSDKRDLAIYGQFFLEEELHKLAMMHGFEYTYFTLHDCNCDKQYSYGFCAYQERFISCNLNLLCTSEKFIRHVLLHELVHLEIHGHSKKFYKRLNALCGYDTQKVRIRTQTDILNPIDAVGIVKRKTRELFEQAQAQGIKLPMETKAIRIAMPTSQPYICTDYEQAAMEKKNQKKNGKEGGK